jgi:hypothetical protein
MVDKCRRNVNKRHGNLIQVQDELKLDDAKHLYLEIQELDKDKNKGNIFHSNPDRKMHHVIISDRVRYHQL